MTGPASGRNPRRAAGALLGVATLLAALISASAAVANHSSTWQAKPVAQGLSSAVPELGWGLLESGERDSAFIDAQNVGTITWDRDAHGLHLGTDAPHDRLSLFEDGWLNRNRPATLTEALVAPGGVGRFSFTAQAPQVTSEQTFDEHFAPVADSPGGEWLDGPSWGNAAGDGVFLRWTVRPPQIPVATLTSVPNLVDPGAPVSLTANASDNVRVTKVIFSIADRPPVIDTTRPYAATLSTAGIPQGIRVVKAVAVDGIGQEAFDQAFVEVGAPVLGEIANAEPVSGTVLVAVPPAPREGRRFVPLEEARRIPVGSFFDTRRGRVRLRTATTRRGEQQMGEFLGGVFQVLQSRKRGARGVTELRLKGASFRRCGAAGRGKGASAARGRSRRAIRRLRGNARGRFRTSGRHSSATVRGTAWSVTDRCDGTLTKVTRGKVAVRDFRRRKTILLRAGKSYLARARR